MSGPKIIIITVLFFVSNVFAEAIAVSQEQLVKRSDLIVIGAVDKIETTGETVTIIGNCKAQVKYANILAESTLKGKSASPVIVKYAYSEDVEADVQDPNFRTGEKILLYLRSNNDKKGSYSVVNKWSGVGRFYEGRFYHQYSEEDFYEYTAKLKKIIETEKQDERL